MVRNKRTMQLAGWDVDVNTVLSYHKDGCGTSSFVGYRGNTAGTVSTTFQGFGRASLDFGNCGSYSNTVINVFVNDTWIASAKQSQKSLRINFYYKPLDELRIVAMNSFSYMVINSLQILCGGKNIKETAIE